MGTGNKTRLQPHTLYIVLLLWCKKNVTKSIISLICRTFVIHMMQTRTGWRNFWGQKGKSVKSLKAVCWGNLWPVLRFWVKTGYRNKRLKRDNMKVYETDLHIYLMVSDPSSDLFCPETSGCKFKRPPRPASLCSRRQRFDDVIPFKVWRVLFPYILFQKSH